MTAYEHSARFLVALFICFGGFWREVFFSFLECWMILVSWLYLYITLSK